MPVTVTALQALGPAGLSEWVKNFQNQPVCTKAEPSQLQAGKKHRRRRLRPAAHTTRVR